MRTARMELRTGWLLLLVWSMVAMACAAQGPGMGPAGALAGNPMGEGQHDEEILNVLYSLESNATETPAQVKGMNFSMSHVAQHNSVTGWAFIVTPVLSYRVNRHFSFDSSLPWYWTVKNYVPVTVKSVTTNQLKEAEDIIGDFRAAGHAQFSFGNFDYMLTASGAFPTGNSTFGLSANSNTYNLSNHLEYALRSFCPDIEAGFGDSSSLVGQNVKKTYTAIGPLADFQAGSLVNLPFKTSLEMGAYENMPVGDQRVWGTVTTKNKKGKYVTTQVLEGSGVAEDNGFQSELDIPLFSHLVLSGNYERSLRQRTDTMGFMLIWVLRAPGKHAAR
ncbi:hypothetical protein ACOBR2_05640 [Telmatobacter bradus]|uniref:hypothetical protein n=1 Tax=Telmatobacter bradus TaxID=474953 RepID=UPI003B42AB97